MEKVDACVVGGGVVGLAVSRALASRGLSVLTLETHPRHGVETSSRNSEVVHSGLYYPKDSLKARLCVEGNALLRAYCGKNGVFLGSVGKLVVACAPKELATLARLKGKGEANGVRGIELLDEKEARRRAPGVKSLGALWIPSTGIVDGEELMLALRGDAEKAGAIFLWGTTLVSARRGANAYELELSGGERVSASAVVNSAGLRSDAVAAMPGLDVDAAGYRLRWFKGEYFSLKRKLDVAALVYPVPAKHGLGIHLTLDRAGAQRLGPNAFAVDRVDYSIDPGHAASFFEAASRYLAGLRPDDLQPGTSGIRPKLAADGSFRDFVVAEESACGLPRWVNLVGIESPGLTASLAIAGRVAELLRS